MRIALTVLDPAAVGNDLVDGVLSSLSTAVEGSDPPVSVDVVAPQASPQGEPPDVIVALVASVATTVLPEWVAKAGHVPLIGVWTSGEAADDLVTIPSRWDDVVSRSDTGRLIRAVRRVLARIASERHHGRDLSLLRDIIDLVPHCTFSYDGDGRLILANRAMARVYERPVDMVEGRTFAELQAVPEEASRLTAKAREVIREGRPVHDEAVAFTYNDGSVHLLDINLLPIPGSDPTVLGVAVDVTAQKQAEQEIKQAIHDLNRLLSATVDSLSLSVEERDPYTAGHQSRVARLAVALAEELALAPDRIAGIRIGATLHDIGKLAIPSEILAKPGRLGHEEYQLVKTHAACGHKIIANVPFPWPVGDMVLHHHERLDGSGYPDGLSGRDISLESRILGVCDVFEAMANHRPYRPALGTERALAAILEGRGTLFDPDVVDALGRVAARSENRPLDIWEGG